MIIEKNTVSAQEQVQKTNTIEIVRKGGKYNVLFVGNSITRHTPKSEIGWEHDWGMAASAKEKDYVHVTVKLLEEKLGLINYYYEDERLEEYTEATAFQPNIVIIRIGENMWSAKEQFDSRPIAPHYAKMVEYFSSNPQTKLVLTDLFWKNPTIDDAIHTVAKENGYVLVSLGDLSENQENMAIGKFWHEGVAIHPGDLGMQRIAERIAAAVLQQIID